MSNPEIMPELCETVINRYVTPMFEANRETGLFGRQNGSLLMVRMPEIDELSECVSTAIPNADFYNNFVVYEHTWGTEPIGVDQIKEGTFTMKALQKAFGSFVYGKDYEKVLTDEADFVAAHGLIAFPGAVVRDITPHLQEGRDFPKMIASYSGLWWWHDSMIAGMTLDGLKAELTLRGNNP